MARTVEEWVSFEASAAELFAIYTDSEQHSAALGCDVLASELPGATFSAFDGQVRGRNLLVEPGARIVQSWRGSVWAEDDPDSIVVLAFEDTPAGGAIHLTHAGIPDHCHPFIDWERAYWRPWRSYLRTTPRNQEDTTA